MTTTLSPVTESDRLLKAPVHYGLQTTRSSFLDRINNPTSSSKSNTTTYGCSSLEDCFDEFHNDDTLQYYKLRTQTPFRRVLSIVLELVAATVIYAANTLTLETLLLVTNAIYATYFYCINASLYSTKLDFTFLAFSVVFPLTFLVNTVTDRRNEAVHRFADLKSGVENAALVTFTCDWPTESGGRRGSNLPDRFNKEALLDFKDLLQNVYHYLSMPDTNHNRNALPCFISKSTSHIYEQELNTLHNIRDKLLDFSMHVEVMRRAGFPDVIASRLMQHHQDIRERIEHIRVIKNYGTPQLPRAFGLVYIFILPWIIGPYFAWVYEETGNSSYTLLLSGFTSLILMGLLNMANSLQDPFIAEPDGINLWISGLDVMRLNHEFAVMLHSIEHYFHAATATDE